MPNNSPRKIPIHYRRENCRLCLSKNIELLFSLEPTPPAEWYFRGKDRDATAVSFPLDLFMCNSCKHVQLLDVLDPQTLFSEYFYESVSSPGLAKHFQEYANDVSSLLQLLKNSLIVDIGSNDGLLLKQFEKLGYRVIGIEPSVILAQQCNLDGLLTYNSFLNNESVENIITNHGHADLVTANNVFAHNDDLANMAECVSKLLVDNGVFVFEVSSLLHTMKGLVFDYIYHEHLSYHSLISLIPFLRRFSLQIFDMEIVGTKGGSYRVYAKKTPILVEKSERLSHALDLELSSGLESPLFYKKIHQDLQGLKNELHVYLSNLPPDAVIAGYGASATTTTLTYEFELNHIIDYLVDDNSIRHGNFLPGTNLQVFNPQHLNVQVPSHVIILAWRFSQMILEKLFKTLPKGITFIVPLPQLKIIRNGE